jgi:hypothetical protein
MVTMLVLSVFLQRRSTQLLPPSASSRSLLSLTTYPILHLELSTQPVDMPPKKEAKEKQVKGDEGQSTSSPAPLLLCQATLTLAADEVRTSRTHTLCNTPN